VLVISAAPGARMQVDTTNDVSAGCVDVVSRSSSNAIQGTLAQRPCPRLQLIDYKAELAKRANL
jgi:hypothetical protein